MSTRSARLMVSLVAVALIASACGSSKSSTSSTTGAANTSSSTGAKSNDPSINQWAIDYTGGKPQKATGTPIDVGYVNQDTFFPEATIGVDAAVAYANAELNGADGHPIHIVSCQVATASDGARCGAQMANNPAIQLVLTGTLLEGNTELYNAMNGKRAVIIGNGVTPADFTTPVGEAFVAGAPGVLKGMAQFAITQFHPKTVALLANDNASGHAGAALLMAPIFAKANIDVKTVFVPDQANGAQVQSAMQAAGAGKADAFVSILTLQTCISMYDAIKTTGIKPNVVTTGLCFGTPMTDHLKQAGDSGTYPDGWYFGDYGYNYFMPSSTSGMQESGMNTYLAKVHQYGKPAAGAKTLEYSGFAGPMFANVLTAVKFINQIGADQLTVSALDAKIRGFTGPMMLQVGPLKCGVAPYVSVCGYQIGIDQYKNGKWLSINNGHNGKPIDTSTGT